MATARPANKSALRILPTPKYLRITNRVIAEEIMRPLRDLAKIIEKVKKRQENSKTKNKGREKTKLGLTK